MERRATEISQSATFSVSRRDALKLAGGATLSAFALAGVRHGAVAQEATPVASPAAGRGLLGQFVIVRARTLKPDRSGDELLGLIRDGFLPLIEDVPGFVSYIAVANDETRDQFSVGVYADKAGADESTRRAGEWGALGAADYVEGDPDVSEGIIGVAAEAVDALPAGILEASPAATPVADGGFEGKYVAVRFRQPNPAWTAEETLRLVGEGYVPLVRKIPGFVAYFGSADEVVGNQAYVVIFDDKAGADESTRVAREWLTENSYDFFMGDPVVAEGVIGVAAEAGA